MSKSYRERVARKRSSTTAEEVRDKTPEQTCLKCGETKLSMAFRVEWSNRHGLRKTCIDCERKENKLRSASRIGAYDPEYKRKMYRKYALRNIWGLTEADYDDLLDAQLGVCAICGSDKPGGRSRNFHIDHDHESGEIRGLLCGNCNTAIGLFKDNPELLMKAIEYLKKPPARRMKFRLVKSNA